ncbi:hypothetical protein MLD38_019669 [Melastoma candidum]|uniref:Uncharacterized protein n=1 Tax=Melastoma candidum TaxID=119954 RepID=A0ACB9QXQ0_9MYRT|nr:hypothetical protein MLD38_019669 [Melastoma candidum]
MDSFAPVPPGFRFHPTDEELVDYYLRKKVASKRIDLDVIKDVDLYKIEPWDLQELCKIGNEEQREWYFFSHKDKKYPTGTRTNRATKAGFWKATGRDKGIYTKNSLIGMRKTLVYYKGRAPNGQKSDWIMHEYRLETNENAPPQASLSTTFFYSPRSSFFDEGWVVCRAFKKRLATMRRIDEYDSPCWYDDQAMFMPDLDYPKIISQPQQPYLHQNTCKQERDMTYTSPGEGFPQMPHLESPKIAAASNSLVASGYERTAFAQDEQMIRRIPHQNMGMQFDTNYGNQNEHGSPYQVTDWRVLDRFVASQLSHDNAPRGSQYSDSISYQVGEDMNVESGISSSEILPEFASSSASPTAFQVDLWK